MYDVATKTSVKVDVRGGKPFENDVVGHYVYRVGWSPDGKDLLFTRTNRRQNIMEFVAADPATGVCRVIIREEWPTGWIETSPTQVFLKDGRLLIYYGTADNNVHPTNAMQLIQALQKAGKSFEVQVGPDAGHSGVNPQRVMEFFIENLVINPPKRAAAVQ